MQEPGQDVVGSFLQEFLGSLFAQLYCRRSRTRNMGTHNARPVGLGNERIETQHAVIQPGVRCQRHLA